ncbi:MAG: hypothetical protein AAGJ82_11700 [Bacteroidota bacterium]
MRYLSLIILLYFLPQTLSAQLRLSLETGLVFTQYNDVRVPNREQESGTLFSLADDFRESPTTPFIRVEAAYLLGDKHTIELTAAPLQIEYEDNIRGTFDFADRIFIGPGITGRYEFNTYRATYRYRFVDRPRFRLDAGASVLVRDARIALTQGAVTVDDTDLGFVPLLSFELDYTPTEILSLFLKGDALVGPQGRAEDIFAGVLVNLGSDRWKLKAGYRLIEGGADVDQVYNFAFIHFASVGVMYGLTAGN